MEFKILGPLEVRDGGRDLSGRAHKQRLLLAVLLLRRNEVVSRDRLIDALWGDRPPERAAKALQMHVLELRKMLEPERAPGGAGRILQTRPAGYALALEPGQLDLERFEQAVAQASVAATAGHAAQAAELLRAALALWRGPPLADLAAEEALRAEIGRLEEVRLAALEDRIDADLALGRHAALTGEVERLIAEHPLRERLRAQAMLALYRCGRQAEALETYRSTRATLVEELGIEPGRELRELERRVLAQDPGLDLPAPAPPAPAAPAGGTPAGTFVGRERELAQALSLLDGALTGGQGALLLIGGEPGIGKSRLAEALAARADAGGARVLVGRCWEAGGAPAFWPWVQALRAYVRQSDPTVLRAQAGTGAADLATILPELRDALGGAPPAAPAEGEGARFRLFEALASFLRAAAAERPLAVFLDDLHAADAPSLLLLRFLAGQLAGSPLLVVGCHRDADATAPELAEALAELAREPHVRRIALTGLDHDGTARLLAAAMGRAPGGALVARVYDQTRGNPLFAAEIGRLLAVDDAGAAEGEPLPIPRGVREAIGARVQARSAGCREVLALASVLGREFDPRALLRVSGLGEDALFAALDEAAGAQLVGDVPGSRGRLRFAHILVRDVLYDELPAPRRLLLERRIGEALEQLYARHLDPHLAEVAHHYLAAGSAAAERSIDFAARAGDHAAALHGYEEAARHYAAALGVLEETGSGNPRRTCELLLALGEALSRSGREREAKEALRRAAPLAERSGLPGHLARAALNYGGRFTWARAGTDPALVPLLERGLEAVGDDDPATRVRLLARLAAARRDDVHSERRIALAREAVDLARRLGDPVTLAYAREGWWIATEGQLGAGDALALSDELIAIGERIGDQERVYAARDFRLQELWRHADRAALDVELDTLARLADELRQPAQRWHLATSRTMLALMEGRFADAEALVDEALGIGDAAETWNAAVSQRLQLFVLRRAQGRLAELEPVISRSVHEFPALPRFRCALAHLHAELGHEAEARALLDDLLGRDLAHEHVDAEWLFTLCLLPDPCAAVGDHPGAAKLYALLLPYGALYAQAPVEAPFGSVARGLGVLATTLGDHDAAERHFGVALEIERRMRARPWEAHARHGLATALLARDAPGDVGRARELLDAAAAGYRALGMESWAARAAPPSSGGLRRR